MWSAAESGKLNKGEMIHEQGTGIGTAAADHQGGAHPAGHHGSAVETDDYERAIILTGAAWGLDPKSAAEQLELIVREKEMVHSAADPDAVQHVLPESDLPMNASGMETLDNICDLFETAVQLDDQEQREALFRLASELAETQNLLDWILKTPEEQELPETAES